MRAEFFHFNHLKPKFDKNLDFGKRVLVFTAHTIEQVLSKLRKFLIIGLRLYLVSLHF